MDDNARISPEPVVVPREGHSISRKDLSPGTLKTLYRLKDAGYVACVAGGGVRDLLVGRKPKDFDVATDAHPEQVRRLFRNSRLIGRRFRLVHALFGDEIIEISTFRGSHDGDDQGNRFIEKNEHGQLIRDNKYGTPGEDALRRDFTCNSLFYNIADFSIIDYTGGLKDIEARCIRSIGDPAARIEEDPVRMIRAVRFAGTLGFTIEPELDDAIRTHASSIQKASAPRMFEECKKLFLCGHALDVYRGLVDVGLFRWIFPELTMAMERDPTHRTWLEKVMGQFDRWRAHGASVSAELMFALLFGKLHEDMMQSRIERGMAPFPAAEQAVTDHLVRLSQTVFIPKAIVRHIAHLMALQTRMEKPNRKYANKIVRRQSFHDALIYFKLRKRHEGCDADLVAWWEEVAGES